jgi:adenine-specific DNA-methyltransferase
VDLNPHQVDAALFALRSPYSKGVLLADEVGLGKTIEAGLILAQKWAERRRKILLIVPATLRKQWQAELEDKFFLPSTILETKTASDLMKKGIVNPFEVPDRIAICSYQFAYTKRALIHKVSWDLVVMDEAHRLRSIYKGTKTAKGIAEAIAPTKKLMLTATPLQNTLLELYGLVSILDPDLFGDQASFQAQFMVGGNTDDRDANLRERLEHVCKRTLRRQVLEYINFTQRFTFTVDFIPSKAETELYDKVSSYLQRGELAALPKSRRQLMTLILRKLLASSSSAIGATLAKFAARLQGQVTEDDGGAFAATEDFEAGSDLDEEWEESDGEAAQTAAVAPVLDQPDPRQELSELDEFVRLAKSIDRDAKASKLLDSLPAIFVLAHAKGAATKAVIFTESRKTQEALFQLLTEHGYRGRVVLMNGTNTDAISKATYAAWKKKNAHRWAEISSGSKSADMKAAIVEEFRERGTILLATESAAEGINLQFCSIVVNYDLPWNPQRIEQRIGRCHRYGQTSDVLVVNFLNRANEADQRVFDLLEQKFQLFEGVFGASDEVLGAVESGVAFEKRVLEIYQNCRMPAEIKAAFDQLQAELEDSIREGMAEARRTFLDNFDNAVHERLNVHKEAAKQSLSAQQRQLLDLAKYAFADWATFDPSEARFWPTIPKDDAPQRFHLDWQRAEALGDTFFRVGHELAERTIAEAIDRETPVRRVEFTYDSAQSALGPYLAQSGWLEVSKLAAEAQGRTEEFLLVAACDDEGREVPVDVAVKLFALRGEEREGDTPSLDGAPAASIAELRQRLAADRVGELEQRSHSFFEEESLKLERRSDDLVMGLEREIAQLSKDIKAQTKAAKRALALADKLEAQKVLRSLEDKRIQKQRHYFEERDRLKADRDAHIASIEAQLAQKATHITPVFTLRWTLVGPAMTAGATPAVRRLT